MNRLLLYQSSLFLSYSNESVRSLFEGLRDLWCYSTRRPDTSTVKLSIQSRLSAKLKELAFIDILPKSIKRIGRWSKNFWSARACVYQEILIWLVLIRRRWMHKKWNKLKLHIVVSCNHTTHSSFKGEKPVLHDAKETNFFSPCAFFIPPYTCCIE